MHVVFDLFSTTTLGFIKIGALLFFRRVFCVLGRKTFFAHATLITIIMVALWIVALDIATGLACGTHFTALWTGARNYANYCHKNSWRFLLSLAVSDFILDIWILSLPLPQVSVGRHIEERLQNLTLSDLGHPNVAQAEIRNYRRVSSSSNVSMISLIGRTPPANNK